MYFATYAELKKYMEDEKAKGRFGHIRLDRLPDDHPVFGPPIIYSVGSRVPLEPKQEQSEQNQPAKGASESEGGRADESSSHAQD